MPRHPRSAPSAVAMLLAAIAALGLAGCAADGNSDSARGLTGDKKDASMLKVGDASRAAGDCAAAVRFYRLVKDDDGNHRDAFNARLGAADCELSLNALPDAEHDYKEAMKLRPADPAPLVGLGRVYLVQHVPGQAAGYLDQAVKKGADAAYVWNDLGVAYDQLRRHKDAQQAYRRGLAKFPADRALRNNLALSLAMTRDFAEAETLLRGLAADPGATSRIRENLALVLGLEGNAEEARRTAQGDLDGAALDNNTRFYEYARALLTGEPAAEAAAAVPVPTARAVTEKDRAPRAEIAAAPVPPPVLVKDRPLAGLRMAAPAPIEHTRPAVVKTALPAPAPVSATPPAAPAPAVAAAPAATPAVTQTAALPAASESPKPAAAAPTRIVPPSGAAPAPQPVATAAQPVASSE